MVGCLGGKGAYSFGCEGLVTLDAGAELAGLVADCVGVAGGGHNSWVWWMLYGVYVRVSGWLKFIFGRGKSWYDKIECFVEAVEGFSVVCLQFVMSYLWFHNTSSIMVRLGKANRALTIVQPYIQERAVGPR